MVHRSFTRSRPMLHPLHVESSPLNTVYLRMTYGYRKQPRTLRAALTQSTLVLETRASLPEGAGTGSGISAGPLLSYGSTVTTMFVLCRSKLFLWLRQIPSSFLKASNWPERLLRRFARLPASREPLVPLKLCQKLRRNQRGGGAAGCSATVSWPSVTECKFSIPSCSIVTR